MPSGTLLPSATGESLAAGTTPIQADVTADGAASVVLPLWVPPGRAGIQPNLSLAYNSRGGDGWLGMGFQLTGLSQIASCPQTPAQDGIHAHPATPLCLDGMRLVPVATGEYRLEVDSHIRVRSTPSSFEVSTPDGRISTYGKDGTREDAVWRAHRYPTQENTVLAWRLSSVRDTWGNRMDVFYESSPPDDGHSSWHRPVRIRYTRHDVDGVSGSGLAALRSVSFVYQDRPDTFLGYQKGARIGRTHRLAQVVMSGPAYGTGALETTVLRSYQLTYINTSVSGRSLLSSVQECDGAGVCKPSVRFDWQLGSWDFVDKPVTELLDAQPGVGVHAFGLGAGRTGLSFFTHTSPAEDSCDPRQPVPCEFWRRYWHRILTFRPGGTFQSTYHVGSGASIWDEDHPGCQEMDWSDYHPQVVDWDGHGKSSLAALSCISYSTPAQPTGWSHLFIGRIRGLPDKAFNIGSVSKMALWLDMDGDHLNDFAYSLATAGNGRELHLDTSSGVHLTASPGLAETKFGARVVDLYGDGRMAVVGEALLPPSYSGTSLLEPTPLYAFRYELWSEYDGNRGYALVPVKTSIQRPFWSPQTDLNLVLHPHEFFFADVNGDGLGDAVSFGYDYEKNATRLDFQVNSGLKENATQEGQVVGESSFLPPRVQHISGLNPYTRLGSEIRSGDFNADGRQDVLVVTPSMSMRVLLADTEGSFSRVQELAVPAGSDPAWVQVVDVDNDGLLDVTHRQGNQLHVAFRKDRPDVLRAVRPGTQLPDAAGRTGPEISFTYGPLADPSVYTTPFIESFAEELKHLRRASETMLVVKHLSDGISQRSWAFTYKDGRVDVEGRGWLGFAERTVVNTLTGDTTTTRYNNGHQDKEGRNNGNYLVDLYEEDKKRQSWAAQAHRPTYQVETVQVGNGTVRRRELTWTYQQTPRAPANTSERPGSYQQYVSSIHEVVSEQRSGEQGVTLWDTQTGQTRDVDGMVTAAFSRRFTGSKVEEVRRTVVPLAEAGSLFDVTTWRPRGTWVARTDWVECARTAMGPCNGVQPSAALQQVSRTTYGGRGEITTTELMPDRAGEKDDEKVSAFYLKTAYERDLRGLVTRVVRTNSTGATRSESYAYDSEAITLRHTYDSMGNGARYAFVPGLGVLAAVADANGAWRHMRYDGFGRQRGESTAAGGMQSVEYAWEERLPLVRTRIQGGGDSLLRYDARGRVVQQESSGFGGARVFIDTTYDGLGRVETQSLPWKASEQPRYVTFQYDGLDRLVRQTLPDGSATTYGYLATPSGVRTSVADADNHRREQLTDTRGLLVESSELAEGGRLLTTRYEYGPFGRLTATVAPDGARIHQRHDVLGRTEWTSDESAGERFLAYNAFGEVKWEEEGAWRPLSQPLPEPLPTAELGAQTVFTRDAVGRVTQQVVRAPHQTGDAFLERVSFVWDTADLGTTGGKARGLLAEARREMTPEESQPAQPMVETRYTYDGLGRPATTTLMVEAESFTTEQRYDTLGRPSQLLYPKVPGQPRFAVDYTYASEGGVQSVHNAHTGQVYWRALAYNGAGQLTRESFGARVERVHRYDSLGRLRFLDARNGMTPVQRLAYEYSPGGNLTARHDVLGPYPASESFTYDALDRLKRWEVAQGTCGPPAAVDYTYDDAGNLTKRTTGEQVSASYTPTPVGTFPRNAVHAASLDGIDFSYVYDARGNQVAVKNDQGGLVRKASYTSFHLPKTLYDASTVRTSTYAYDAFGSRVRTSVNGGTEDVVSVGSLYQRRRQGSTVTHRMSVQGPTGIVAEVTLAANASASPLFLLSDRLGSPDTVVSQEGTLVERLKYEPFGERRSASNLLQRPSGGAAVRAGFTGHEEAVGGLTDMGGRLYDARLARFLSPDPVVVDTTRSQAFHAYAYVLNNPLKYTDPSGLTPEGGGLPGASVSTTYDYGGGWTAHVFSGGPSPNAPQRDPLLDASAVPQTPSWAVDDGTHLPNQYKNDAGSSASPSPGPQPSLLATGIGGGGLALWMQVPAEMDASFRDGLGRLETLDRFLTEGAGGLCGLGNNLGMHSAACLSWNEIDTERRAWDQQNPNGAFWRDLSMAQLILGQGRGGGGLHRGHHSPNVLYSTVGPPATPLKLGAAKDLGRVLYPRGPGAATGAIPRGHVPVSRWVNQAEAKLWIENGGTYIPGGVGGQSGRIYVTVPGAPRPGGTGPVRIDFTVDSAALNTAGKEGWFQIVQPVQNMPIHNVTITYSSGM